MKHKRKIGAGRRGVGRASARCRDVSGLRDPVLAYAARNMNIKLGGCNAALAC